MLRQKRGRGLHAVMDRSIQTWVKAPVEAKKKILRPWLLIDKGVGLSLLCALVSELAEGGGSAGGVNYIFRMSSFVVL